MSSEYQDKETLNKTKNGETTVSDLTFALTEGVCNFVKATASIFSILTPGQDKDCMT